jgi:hypothetical protein
VNRRRAALCPAVLGALLLAGCGGSAAPPPVTVTVTVPVPAPGAGAPRPAKSATMPDLVGVGLQEAQDRMQELTGNPLFVTTSHDASGAGRQQLLDRNWKVCDQNVAPGTRITEDTRIDFGAVKVGERC